MNKESTNSAEFLATCSDLDRHIRRILHQDEWVVIKKMATKNEMFSRHKEDLINFAKLRNAIVHNPDKKYAKPIAEPHDYILDKYKEISDKVKYPPIAINADNIYTTDINVFAIDVMKDMNIVYKNSLGKFIYKMEIKLI